MRVLILTATKELLPLATRIEAEGHTCVTHVHSSPRLPAFYLSLAAQASPDIILSDMGRISDFLRARGYHVWGSSKWGDLLRRNEAYAKRVTSIANANPHTDDLLHGGWWTGTHFSLLFQVVPKVGFMDGGHGPRTLEGIFLTPERHSDLLLFDSVLKRTSHQGPVLLGSFLVASFNIGIHAALTELLLEEQLTSLTAEHPRVRKQCALAVHISLPPYPYATGETTLLEVDDGKHLWLKSMDRNIQDDVGWVSARGVDLRECKRRVYRTIKKLNEQLPELQFRTDLGSEFSIIRKSVLHPLRVIKGKEALSPLNPLLQHP